MAALALTLLAGGLPQGAACPDLPAPVAVAPEAPVTVPGPDGPLRATRAGPAGRPAAHVLMLHGHGGDRDEFRTAAGEGLFARAARAFAAAGIASLRVDLHPPGGLGDTTLAAQVAAARAAFGAGAVLGFSQGGLVALAAFADGGPDRVVLWNPVLDPGATYATLYGPPALAQADRLAAAGQGDAVVPGTGLRARFLAGIRAGDPTAQAAALPVPLMIAAGAADRIAAGGPGRATALAAARAAPTVTLTLPAGHDLGAAGDPALTDAMIACTAAFLLGLLP